jgi:deoxyribodipyrimidine photo-lyase
VELVARRPVHGGGAAPAFRRVEVKPLPLPRLGDVPTAEAWVRRHLGDVVDGEVAASARFRGGQRAADAALASLDLDGYAARRNEVWPAHRRGATAISPYVRHGLLQLPTLWQAAAGAAPADRDRFRDELLWQEYSRHVYARLGAALGHGLRHRLEGRTPATVDELWDPALRCLALNLDELRTQGYLVNQARMWLASHWAVREGGDWRSGEEVFFRHLLDGSRAANRVGWQWTAGTATGRPYAFSRWQVERRAPGLCSSCALREDCPIEDPPPEPEPAATAEHPALRSDPNPRATGGPVAPQFDDEPEAVWLTAESLGDGDPAARAHPELPAVFVLDHPLLARLRLSGKRLVLLVETLTELAERREVEVHVGDPVLVLRGRRLAATWTPVPGWRRRSSQLEVVARYPWPWLRRPHGGSIASFSAWRKAGSSPPSSVRSAARTDRGSSG